MITLSQYLTQLEAHDWFHHMSDSHEVWRKGRDTEQDLWATAKQGGAEYIALFVEYKAHVFSGPMYGTPKKSKPNVA